MAHAFARLAEHQAHAEAHGFEVGVQALPFGVAQCGEQAVAPGFFTVRHRILQKAGCISDGTATGNDSPGSV